MKTLSSGQTVMVMSCRVIISAAAISLIARMAVADDWPQARPKAVVSENGQLVVRLIPGNSIGDSYGFAGAAKGRFARAEWFRFAGDGYRFERSAQLVNPVAPVAAAVANDGTLITFDNWHNMGIGDAVAIYGPDGKIRKTYKLADLYSKSALERIAVSVSSVWWRCPGPDPSVDAGNNVEVMDTLGGGFTFQLSSGKYKYEPDLVKCGT